jgi:putative transposase
MIRYINEHKDQFGVEAICRVLRPAVRGFITSRGYRAAKTRPPSARSLKDELLVPEIARLHDENYGVYGVRKMHALMRRRGWEVGRDQTARLMKIAGVQGVKRSKKVFTTKSDPAAVKPADLVQRHFKAEAPRRLWVADITYVATWSGFAYVAFVTDVYSRRIVGWNVAGTLRADLGPMPALDMAAWDANREGAADLTGLIHHADHGSNYLSIVYTDRIAELGATPSTGTVGDSYDNALAEAVNGLYKTELIRRRGPWKTIEQVELATLEYVWWWNNQRLHGELDMCTPLEVEAAYYAAQESSRPALAGQGNA